MSVSQASDKATVAPGQTALNLPPAYLQVQQRFTWPTPKYFNIAEVCCARWARQADAAQRLAIKSWAPGATSTFHSYAELQKNANRLSALLVRLGVQRGERVAIVLPQRFETAVAYIALLQMGAVAMPLSMLFGPQALAFRLQDSAAVLAICDAQSLAHLRAVRAHCPELRQLLSVTDASAISQAEQTAQSAAPSDSEIAYSRALASAAEQFTAVNTLADDPAILIYTSGTTGNPKGALIPQRALIGNLSGFVCSQNGFGFAQPTPTGALIPDPLSTPGSAIFWSPADWAWTGGLMDALLPTLYFGRQIVAYNGRFGAQTAMQLLAECAVTHSFLFPTALKAIMKAYPGTPSLSVRTQFALKLQALMSAGEAVGDAVFDYCQKQLGVTLNEMFGQTEINYIVGNCSALWPAKPGSMGLGYAGHQVAVLDEASQACAVGVIGEVALNRFDLHGVPDPVFFLGYWKNDAATQSKFSANWCRTGDLASMDGDGYLWYQGRSDDMFKAAGYRIGPGEIENCLVKHPAVANAAVVAKPDAARGALVKAYVVLAADYAERRAAARQQDFDAALVAELQDHVRGKLAPYEYPKEIEFIDALPMTTTGKVQRRLLRLQEQERARRMAPGEANASRCSSQRSAS